MTTIARGLDTPWDITFLPDGRALVTERPGRVRIVTARGGLAGEPAATVRVDRGGEGGLLGIALDPGFSEARPFVYLSATVDGRLQVQRWRLRGQRLVRDGVVIDDIPAPGSIHVSGRVRFGPDGAMYIGTGDAGDGRRAQDPGSLNGKMLRIPPGAQRSDGVRPAVVASGLRHPQGLAWLPSGRMIATDHGPSGFDGPSGDDELNVIERGANYGWPAVRGPSHGRFRAPAHVWRTTIAPTSVAVVSQGGSTWSGDALVAALRGQQLRRLTFSGARVVADRPLLVGEHGRLRAIAEAPDGAIWVGTSNRDGRGAPRSDDDRILRIVPPAAPGGGRGGGFTVSARQLLINQRISQTAIRRLRAVEAVLDGRPAPVGPPRRRPGAAAEVTVSPRQLLINQRIAQGALRLHARLARRVPGVDAPRIGPSDRTPVRLRLTRRQLQINQRIGQAAVRRANALRDAVARGS